MPDKTKGLSMDRPDSSWRRVYAAVVVTTFVVISALWAFSRFFSS